MSQPSIRLLLMHADPEVALRLRHNLSGQGCDVSLCPDPAAAPAQLTPDAAFHLLLLDAALGESAAALWRQVRAQPSPVPVLILCPGAREADRVWWLKAGADDVLPSTFGLAECLARCRARVRRHQLGQEHPTVLSCGAVRMWVEEHRVCCDAREVSLTPREFLLLRFLLEHPRRIWGRQEILERVWGENEAYLLDTKTVDVHIRWLRLKLEADPAQPTLITTVRGRGYCCG